MLKLGFIANNNNAGRFKKNYRYYSLEIYKSRKIFCKWQCITLSDKQKRWCVMAITEKLNLFQKIG